MILNIVLAYLSISSGAIASDKCSQSFELANFPQVRALVYDNAEHLRLLNAVVADCNEDKDTVYYHALKLEEGVFYLNNGDYKLKHHVVKREGERKKRNQF